MGNSSDEEQERCRATLEDSRRCELKFWMIHLALSFDVLVCRNNRSWFGVDHSYHVSLLHFSSLSVDGNLGLKTRFSQGNEREGRKCAWPTWRAWLGLPFDMFISAILEQLGSKVYFPLFFLKHNFDFDALFIPQMTNSRVSVCHSVSVSCERLLEGFHLIWSSL